jgi:hypothetical protein
MIWMSIQGGLTIWMSILKILLIAYVILWGVIGLNLIVTWIDGRF